MRRYPDVSFTAALHDGYLVVFSSGMYVTGGTSASAPAMAGLLALLNQHQAAKGFQSQPGLGNINPQLYRLSQAAPSVYHDTIAGALEQISALGGGLVEGYPEDAADVAAGFLYHGALSTYDKLGFERVHKIGKHRWVVAKQVQPAT